MSQSASDEPSARKLALPGTSPEGRVVIRAQRTGVDVDRVMAHYLAHRSGRRRQTEQPKMRVRVASLLKQYSVDELCAAIDGCFLSKFHIEGNHTGLGLIFRDPEHVDRFIEFSREGPPGQTATEKTIRAVAQGPIHEEPEGSLWAKMRQMPEKALRGP